MDQILAGFFTLWVPLVILRLLAIGGLGLETGWNIGWSLVGSIFSSKMSINAKVAWISQPNGAPVLMFGDKVAILTAWEWTPDRVIRYAHEILREQLHVIYGLEDTTIHVVNKTLKGKPHTERIAQLRKLMNREELDRKKCQIFFVNGNHWVLGTNLHSVAPNQVTVYDTEYPNLYYNMEHELTSVFRVSADELFVSWPDLDRPEKSGDCGIRAIAWMVEVLLNEKRPELLRYPDSLLMRQHLAECIEARHFTRFASNDDPRKVQIVLSHRFKVSCICRMPKMFNAETTIWCKAKNCRKPFHLWCFHKRGVQSGDNTIPNWLCRSCREGALKEPDRKPHKPERFGQKPSSLSQVPAAKDPLRPAVRNPPHTRSKTSAAKFGSTEHNVTPPSVRAAPDVVVAPVVLQLTGGDWTKLRSDSRDRWLNNHNVDAATFLLRTLAAENNFEFSGLYYQDQTLLDDQSLQLDARKTGLYILNYNYVAKGQRKGPMGQGYHWVLLVQKDGQPFICDSALSGVPEIPDGTAPILARLLGMQPGSQKDLLFPAVQQQTSGWDCVLFAIAFAAAIITGSDIDTVGFDTKKMRSFFFACCKALRLRAFPNGRCRERRRPKVWTFRL